MQHNGILFPPEYEAQGISIRIRGERVALNPEQEEMAYQWAKKKDTPYVQDRVFQRNFTADFAKVLGPRFKKISYPDVDFATMNKVVDQERDHREAMTKEQRKEQAAKRKEIRERMKKEYGTAVIDGKEVEVANYMAEPPGIFIGRGAHPLRGRWKRRIRRSDVTLNLGKKARIPDGKWGGIVNNTNATWLASWVDGLTRNTKYVWLADTAGLKQEMDKEKYEKAARLAGEIGTIKGSIVRDMRDKDQVLAKTATACYLIYRTAMRVGDEKDSDEADTVGATTLRKEHVKITENAVEFDFLGKDSIRWKERLPIKGEHDEQFRKNLEGLVGRKKPKDEIFDGITSSRLNRYYSGIVDGLSAKVFRTYLASSVVSKYLRRYDGIKSESPSVKMYHAKMANLEAAVMCNHKRAIPKNFAESLRKRRGKLREVKAAKTWERTEQALAKARSSKPKKAEQKKKKRERIRTLANRARDQKARHGERVRRMDLQIKLAEKTKDYNVGTSLRNYIDPRIFKAWTDEVGAEWEKLYTSALQKKFLWVKNEKAPWKTVSKVY